MNFPGNFPGNLVGDLVGNLVGDFPGGGDFPGDLRGEGQLTPRSSPHLWVGPKRHSDEVVGLEHWFRAIHRLRAIADAADAGTGLLDEVDAVQRDRTVAPRQR